MVLKAIESGEPLREADMTDEQRKVTRAFRLLSEKPRMVVVNTADDEDNPERFRAPPRRIYPSSRSRRTRIGTVANVA